MNAPAQWGRNRDHFLLREITIHEGTLLRIHENMMTTLSKSSGKMPQELLVIPQNLTRLSTAKTWG